MAYALVKIKEVMSEMEVPDLCITVTKAKGQRPVLMSYIPSYDENGEEDILSCTTTNLTNKEYKRWKKANDLERLQIAVKVLENMIELDEMHRGL